MILAGASIPRVSHARPNPSATISLSATSVPKGNQITATMSFEGLEFNADQNTTDYVFRADVVGAGSCEGPGLGKDRYMYRVDEDPETRTGTISADCPAGDYTIEVTLTSPDDVVLAAASADF